MSTGLENGDSGAPPGRKGCAVRAFPWVRIPLDSALWSTAVWVPAVFLGYPVPGWIFPALLLTLAGCVAVGTFWQRAGLYARPILAASPRSSAGRLALTFDDGPNPVYTRRVLDLLEARGHRGTFFVIGERAAQVPELLAEMVRRGHGLANHSYRHGALTPLWPTRRLVRDLEKTQALLTQAGQNRPRWFRAPVGIVSPWVTEAARRSGLELVGWTASARDGVSYTSVDRALERLERALRPGAILVLHDGALFGQRALIAPAVLERLLDKLEVRGLKSVRLDELLG